MGHQDGTNARLNTGHPWVTDKRALHLSTLHITTGHKFNFEVVHIITTEKNSQGKLLKVNILKTQTRQ